MKSLLKKINPDNKMANFVIGGGNIAHQLLQYCNYAYITKVLRSFEDTDTLIPNLDEDQDWVINNESEYHMQDDLMYNYVDYIRISYACSMENIKKGMDRIEEFVKELN